MSSTSPENETDQRGDGALEREEAARYIAALTTELSAIARRADLGLLTYFLEMARMEAQEIAVEERKARRKVDRDG
jgi:hypothetical protein